MALANSVFTNPCNEFHFLQVKFSSGLTKNELTSIAVLTSILAHVDPPSRDAKRSIQGLLDWFRSEWAQIVPWLEFIQLRDAYDQPIDGSREQSEKRIRQKVVPP
jgi:hypothetical protein